MTAPSVRHRPSGHDFWAGPVLSSPVDAAVGREWRWGRCSLLFGAGGPVETHVAFPWERAVEAANV